MAPGWWLVEYVLNAVWQAPLLWVAARLAQRALRNFAPRVLYRVWVLALGLQVLVPAVTLRVNVARWLARLTEGSGQGAPGQVSVAYGPLLSVPVLGLSRGMLNALALVYLCVVAGLAARLALLLRRTALLAADAEPLEQERARAAWLRWKRVFKVARAEIAVSRRVDGPVTLRCVRPVVLLPRGFVERMAERDLEAALAHELAHVARHDFAWNLVHRTCALPLAWHPAVRSTLRHIAEMRELQCDHMAAEAFADPDSYARSLLRLATDMAYALQYNHHHHAIGIFDANTLERRLDMLRNRQTTQSWSRRVAMGVVAVASMATACGSAMALRVAVVQPLQASATGDAEKVASGIMAGQIVSRVQPIYPADAKENKIQGAVVLAARIGKDGTIQALKVLSGPEPLRTSALEAVRQWTYKPYLLNGEPTEVETTITVTYSIG